MARGKKYPVFILPLTVKSEVESGGEAERAAEFYFMQWAFHEPPPHPSTSPLDPFSTISAATPPSNASAPLPPISTILFTTLQEYKLRGSFAQPRLILTLYTDLAASHDIVLIRGEITPSQSHSGYLLTQLDAQLLVIALQRFYVPAMADETAFGLLKAFHESPDEFDHKKLVDVVDSL